jgi:type I restriction enzyme S subunit
MKTKTVPFSWIRRWGLRLDTSPYMGGAVEARVILEKIKFKKEPLRTLTSGHNGGIYNGPMFRRNYVDSGQNGVPFLTSGSMLKADLSDLPFLRRRDAESNKLSYLQLTAGTTMISCSGTIGRMVYARPDMESMWASQDILKVVPDKSRIPSGYLHAFLTGKFGVPLITSGTYGAIIQHIEAEHIADLPVPRLGASVEDKVHELIEKAARNRSRAAELRKESRALFMSTFALPDMSTSGTPLSTATFKMRSGELNRLDAAYHSPPGVQASKALAECDPTDLLGNVAEVFQTNIFKRPYVDDPQFGYPYYSGSELFTYDPEPRGYLRKKAPGIDDYIVKKDWLLMQDAGQLGGLIGQLMRVSKQQDLSVVSNHLIRIAAKNRRDSAYLFTLLSSPVGYRAIVRNAFGSSIPQLESAHLSKISIPWPVESIRQEIANPILKSWELEDSATECDHEAVAIVEKTIEEAA